MKTAWIVGSMLLPLLLQVTGCQRAPTPTVVSPPEPTAVATEGSTAPAGVVVIALAGARADWTAEYLRDGTMPNLATLAKRGVMADALEPVDPALPGPFYLSLSTGAFPGATGLVSEKYHVSQDAFDKAQDRLTQSSGLPELVWRTAMRSGFKTATVLWPGADLDLSDVQANYAVAAVESDIPSVQHVLTFQVAGGWDRLPDTFSPLQESLLRVVSAQGGTVATFNLLAVDTQDDQATNYDLLILDDNKSLSDGHAEVRLGKWATVTISPRLHSSASFCFTASSQVTATVYQSRISYIQARPSDLVSGINELGLSAPPVDVEALRSGWLSAQQYYDMAQARAKWVIDVALHVYRTYHPDLLFTAQNVIADCAQAFLQDAGQGEALSEEAETYQTLLRRAHVAADDNLGRLLSLVNLADSAVFVLSGPGMLPVHTSVRLNTVLRSAKLLKWQTVEGQDRLDLKGSKALAFAAGGSAHIYVNLQGRDQPGVVAAEDYEAVQKQIMQALEGVKDSEGQAVFARIVRGQDLQALHLDSPSSGDVFAQVNPGYCLSDELGFSKVLGPPVVRAAAGYPSYLPEMSGIFVAAGDHLASDAVIPAVHVTDIAPTVAQVLRFLPAETVSGQAIEGIWP